MKITGKDIIEKITNRLEQENIRCYDSAIVQKIRSLTWQEINQLCNLGNVIKWHNKQEVER